jgi:alpha-amylase/alpha-mannosidase (GH57 family)
VLRRIGIGLGLVALVCVAAWGDKAPLNLALVWHQHQPLYWNRLTAEYELPWVRVHAVQEYIDSPRISSEHPDVHTTFNLQPSLLWQLDDYATTTEEETALGGLYHYIGAVDNHLNWIWTLATKPEDLSPENRASLEEQAFWINGYMFDDDANDPYYDARYAELNVLRNAQPLSDQQLLDASALFLLWQISPELHEELGVARYRDHSGFIADDLVALIQAQMSAIQDVVAAYRDIAVLGNELITSPFYHPILPLLVEHGWERDVLGQLLVAQAQHERLFGARSTGVWPPEQAVSEIAVSLLGDAGFSWSTTDEGVLARALGHTPSIAELTTPYVWDGVTLFFRDTELSNRISFSYGNKDPQAAVGDFMDELERAWNALDEPSRHVLTVAMDGENWMFMAGYANNGRTFLRALYEALTEADWVRTVTPGEIIAEGITPTPLDVLPIGSWAGDLSTWSGEPDEDEGWERLAAARQIVTDAGDPPAALEAIYAAEGSDWFWWYGTDQDSGTDDLFDWLFKAHLTGAYVAAGEEELPEVLGLRLIPPQAESLGEVEPAVDGTRRDDEGWDAAVTIAGTGELRELRIGYKETSLYLIVETAFAPTALIGEEDLYLVLYASGAPGTSANVATRHGGDRLGFGLASAIQIRFDKLDGDGSGVVSKYAADGNGGWRYASSIGTAAARVVRVGDRIEFSVPFSELGVEPGKSITLALVYEGSGATIDVLPDRPLLAGIPTLIQGEEHFAINDPAGDDHGTGSYVYPLNDVFGVEGLFDLLAYRVYDADTKWQLAFDFAALTNPWGGPQGFSHPILYLYFDVADGGATFSFEEGEAAHVAFDANHPWDIFIRVAGWPAYGRHLWTAAGEGPSLVEVASDPKRGRIIVTISKAVMPEIEGWHYILVGSQDGYGADYLRAIGTTPGEWTGGGSPDSFWAPQIYDYLTPTGTTQEEILSTFDKEETLYATLIPIHIQFDTPQGGDTD